MCLFQECIKFVVLGFNLIFVLVGAALITIGTIYELHFNNVTDAIPPAYDNFHLVPILTIVVGSIIFLISFFGCCGAIRDSPCLLTTYSIILLTIFILQIALGVFAFLEVKNKEDLQNNVNRTIKDVFINYDKQQELVDFIQSELHCCGVDGPGFWSPKPIPKSCYEDENVSKQLYHEGCQKSFYDFILKAANIIGITVLALAATEVIGATLSLCLANSVRNKLRRGEYY